MPALTGRVGVGYSLGQSVEEVSRLGAASDELSRRLEPLQRNLLRLKPWNLGDSEGKMVPRANPRSC